MSTPGDGSTPNHPAPDAMPEPVAPDPSAPETAPHPASWAEAQPGAGPGEESRPPIQPLPVYSPPAGSKPETDVGFFLLGLFTPFPVLWIIGLLSGIFGIFAAFSAPVFVLLLVAFLVMLVKGRNDGNVRLASYGKGGLWAFAGGALVLLVAFGSCLVLLQGSQF